MQRYSYLNIEDLTDKEALQEKVAAYFAANPLTVSEVCPHVSGYDAGFAQFVTMGELIDSLADEPFIQRAINPSGVLKVLAGTPDLPGLMQSRSILNPIRIGYLDEDQFSILGGRHRLTALLTAYDLSNVDINDSEFRDMNVRVIMDVFDVAKVEADNTCRSVGRVEKLAVKAQLSDIDFEDFDSLMEALEKNTLSAAKVFALAAVLAKKENEGSLLVDLTDETLGAVFNSLYTQYFRYVKSAAKGKKQVEFLMTLLAQGLGGDETFGNLNDALAKVKTQGVTNFARDYRSITAALVDILKRSMPAPAVKMTKKEQKALAKLEAPAPAPAESTAELKAAVDEFLTDDAEATEVY